MGGFLIKNWEFVAVVVLLLAAKGYVMYERHDAVQQDRVAGVIKTQETVGQIQEVKREIRNRAVDKPFLIKCMRVAKCY